MKKILVVDDSRVIRKVARAILENLQFEPYDAESGEQAMQVCRRTLPDAILLDSSLPDMTNFEFMHALRHMSAPRRPKVVFCPSEYDEKQIGRAMQAGADGHLVKPFERSSVLASLEQLGLTR